MKSSGGLTQKAGPWVKYSSKKSPLRQDHYEKCSKLFLCNLKTLFFLVSFQGMFCGLPDDQESLMAPHQIHSLGWFLGQQTSKEMANAMRIQFTKTRESWVRSCRPLQGVNHMAPEYPKHWLQPHVRKTEQPSSNFVGSARGKRISGAFS